MGERIIGIIRNALWGPLGLADQNPCYLRVHLVLTHRPFLVVPEKEGQSQAGEAHFRRLGGDVVVGGAIRRASRSPDTRARVESPVSCSDEAADLASLGKIEPEIPYAEVIEDGGATNQPSTPDR